MGYNTSPALIEDNVYLLQRIRDAVNNSSAFKIVVSRADNISSEQYKVRRVLAATDNHPEVLGGMFRGLGSRTTVRVEYAHGRLSIEPRAGSRGSHTLEFTQATLHEDEAIEELRNYQGSMTTIKFIPSDNLDDGTLVLKLAQIGWDIHLSTKTTNDDDSTSYVVEKKVEEPGFGILDRSPEG